MEHCRGYTEALRNNLEFEKSESSTSSEGKLLGPKPYFYFTLIKTNLTDDDKHPVQTVAHLMKLSFDEGHRQAICQLGGIHTIASLVEVSE